MELTPSKIPKKRLQEAGDGLRKKAIVETATALVFHGVCDSETITFANSPKVQLVKVKL